jgi:hypothetical protein
MSNCKFAKAADSLIELEEGSDWFDNERMDPMLEKLNNTRLEFEDNTQELAFELLEMAKGYFIVTRPEAEQKAYWEADGE